MPEKSYARMKVELSTSLSSSPWPLRRALRALCALLVLQLAFGFVYSWGTVVSYVRTFDHWSPLLTSAVFSAGPLGYATGMVISGRLTERYAPRRLCWMATGLLVIGLGIAFLFPSGLTFIVFYSAIGLGFSGAVAMAASLSAGSSLFPARIGTIGGALTGSYALAALVEAPLVGALAAPFGWLNALRMVGGGVALLAVGAMLVLPSVPRPERQIQPGRRSGSFFQLIGRNAIKVDMLAEATATPLGSYAFVAVAASAHTLHLDLWVATAVVTGVAAGNALGRIGAGVASDRFGVNRVFLVIFGTVLLAALLLAFAGDGAILFLAACLAGISFGGPAGILSRLSAKVAPDTPQAAFGLLFAGFALGAFYGPLLGAAIGGMWGWMTLGSIAVIGWLALTARILWEKLLA